MRSANTDKVQCTARLHHHKVIAKHARNEIAFYRAATHFAQISLRSQGRDWFVANVYDAYAICMITLLGLRVAEAEERWLCIV